jgi:hypothetical protein
MPLPLFITSSLDIKKEDCFEPVEKRHSPVAAFPEWAVYISSPYISCPFLFTLSSTCGGRESGEGAGKGIKGIGLSIINQIRTELNCGSD